MSIYDYVVGCEDGKPICLGSLPPSYVLTVKMYPPQNMLGKQHVTLHGQSIE